MSFSTLGEGCLGSCRTALQLTLGTLNLNEKKKYKLGIIVYLNIINTNTPDF